MAAPSRRLRRARRCTRYRTAATLTRPATTGENRATLTRRVGRTRLRAGRYRATIVATAPGAALPSVPRHARFRITRR